MRGGGTVDKEIVYHGSSMKEIASLIDKDQNDLLEYMQTKDFKGTKSFCFAGFIFQKAGIVAAQMTEPEF